MKGYVCKCGFKTTAKRLRCPRCDRLMTPSYWPNQGTVLAYVRLGIVPVKCEFPADLLLVEIKTGPKIVCWTDTEFSVGDEVTFVQLGDACICSPRYDIKAVLQVPTDDSEEDGGDTDQGELGPES
ncbi:TPA: hypothetical protein HA259_03815 [Thermoplasmata archaeon]|nr:hypothetical protein [Thermoplasmata archaeon]